MVDKTFFIQNRFFEFCFYPTVGVGVCVCVRFGFALLNEWIPTGTCMLLDEMLDG